MRNKKILSDEEKKIRRREYKKKYREKNKEKIAKQQKEYNEKNREKMKEWHRQYNKDNAEKNNARSKKHYEDNKEKYKEKHKKYYGENKEKLRESGKKWAADNREKMKEYHREYEKTDKRKKQVKEYNSRPEVREETRKRNRKYDKKRRADPIFRFNQNISRAIRLSLEKNNLSKNGRHWEDLVGYTSQELREYLESLFTEGMTWKNRGDWHIDHIIPKSFFKFKSAEDVEFKMCWRLKNLQPLWAFDNLRKKDKILRKVI